MKNTTKDQQLQLRLSSREKALIRNAARREGMSVSRWVMERLLPTSQLEFHDLVLKLAKVPEGTSIRTTTARLNDLLASLPAQEFQQALHSLPVANLSPYRANLVAAMVELSAYQKEVSPPTWTARVRPLKDPYFSSTLVSLRPYLLVQSPPPFRKRNLFVDSSVGDRV